MCVLNPFSHVQLFAILWNSLPGSSVHGIGMDCQSPPPGDLPNPRIETASFASPTLQADSLPLSHLGILCLSSGTNVITGSSKCGTEEAVFELHKVRKT